MTDNRPEPLHRSQDRSIRLSPRLLAVASLVAPCDVVYDIGTDHARLPIYLVQSGCCRTAVAADLRHGPLRQAQANIREQQLQPLIRTVQTDGLAGLEPGPDDVVILAGLGGLEIRRILDDAPPCRRLVVQAMKHLPVLRDWLCRQGYRIQAEKLALDRGRYYPVLAAQWQGAPLRLSPLEAWIGPCLLRQPLPAEYLERLHRQLCLQARANPQLKTVAGQLAALPALPENRQAQTPITEGG